MGDCEFAGSGAVAIRYGVGVSAGRAEAGGDISK